MIKVSSEKNGFIAYKIENMQEAIELGKNTYWNLAVKNSNINTFDFYNDSYDIFYLIKSNRAKVEKYAIAVSRNGGDDIIFCNKDDHRLKNNKITEMFPKFADYLVDNKIVSAKNIGKINDFSNDETMTESDELAQIKRLLN